MKYLVAKSYQDLPQIGEAFVANNKTYIQVQTKKGNIKTVRVYTDAEYAKAFPSAQTEPKEKEYTCQKHALGFDNGYILLFKGDIEGNEEWLRREVRCRYTRLWGWFIPSDVETPAIPAGLTTVRLDWELVGKPNGALKPEAAVIKAAESALYDESKSEWQGAINERLELELTVIANYSKENNYGINHTHIFEDAAGNQFAWSTNARNWQVGEFKKVRGTVRSHETFRNIKTTWLTRCMEVK